jgi:hypothetical protein
MLIVFHALVNHAYGEVIASCRHMPGTKFAMISVFFTACVIVYLKLNAKIRSFIIVWPSLIRCEMIYASLPFTGIIPSLSVRFNGVAQLGHPLNRSVRFLHVATAATASRAEGSVDRGVGQTCMERIYMPV